MTVVRSLLVVLLMIALSGCAGLREDPTRNWSASQIYAEAKAALTSGDYEKAVEYYEILEARFPFGRYAQQAQIEIAFAYYRASEPDAALAAVDRFVQLNPRHPNLDYALYLRGLINFNREQGLLTRLFPLDPAEMDTRPLRDSFQDFSRLVRDFPDSRYTEDALARMHFIRNALAGHEVRVAQFYADRGAWVAVSQRALVVVEDYQGSAVMPQALALLIRSYRALGLSDLAEDTLQVLDLNFPEQAAAFRAGRPITAATESGGLMRYFERLPFFTN